MTVRRWIRYGTLLRRDSNNQLHFGISETLIWADFRQDESETTADLDLRIKQTVRGCQWKKETEEERMIDLLYHATIYYKIRKFVQESEPAALTYELVIEKAKAHERNVLEYKDHQPSHRGANSAPSYNNPLLSAHALSKRQSKEFAKFLSGLGIKHTTSSPGYPCSNGFIERHIQTVKNMLSKSSNTRSFQEVLADLRTNSYRDGTAITCWDTSWKEPDNKGASWDRHQGHPFRVAWETAEDDAGSWHE